MCANILLHTVQSKKSGIWGNFLQNIFDICKRFTIFNINYLER